MSSLSRELVFLILQFLDEEKFKETVHKLEQESGFYFNLKYFEDEVQNGNWEEVERYLLGFTKVDDNRYSMKIFFEIRKQKYLEALDKKDRAKAVDILVKDLKVFSSFNEELFKEITQLLTLDNFRENEQLSKYGDYTSARAIMLVELKKLIEANPVFRDKLQFPTLKTSRLRTLINQSLNWQHQLCKNPRPNPDIKTLFVDHNCGQPNGARVPSPAANPLMGAIPKAGGFPPLGAHGPFQAAPTPVATAFAGWMGTNTPAPHAAAVSAGPMGLNVVANPTALLKHPRTPPNAATVDYHSADSDHILKRARGIADEVGIDEIPKIVARTLVQGSAVRSMDFHPVQQTILLVGTDVGDICIWEVGSQERLALRSFKVWDLGIFPVTSQSLFVKDTVVAVNRVVWSPDGSLFGVAYSKHIVHIYSFRANSLHPNLEIDAHNGGVNDLAFSNPNNRQLCFITCGDDKTIKVWDAISGVRCHTFEGHGAPVYSICPHYKENIQFIFSTALDGKIKAWLYDSAGSRVDYIAPGQWCTTMAYSADGTRLFSCGKSKEGESHLVEWNESEGNIKRNYYGFCKRSTDVVQFDTTRNRFLAAGDEFSIKFWDMDNSNLLTSVNADGGLPATPRLRFNKQGSLLAVSTLDNGIKILVNSDGHRLLLSFESHAFDSGRVPAEPKVSVVSQITSVAPSVGQNIGIVDRVIPAVTMAGLNGVDSRNVADKARIVDDLGDKSKSWKLSEISEPSQCRSLRLSDNQPTSKILRLIYTNSGLALLALASNAVHKLWRWQRNDRGGKATTSITPQLWQPSSGIVMTNDIGDANPEESFACFALSKNDSYVMSASGGKVSLFNMMTFKTMTSFMPPPPAATFLAFHHQDNNIIAIGTDDNAIQIYNVRIDEVKSKLKGHQKRVTGLAFSQLQNVLVSSGADAQLFVWGIDGWEKLRSKPLTIPVGRVPSPQAETQVQFHQDQTHFLVVHETQIAIYEVNKLECVRQWMPRESLSSPISHATFSCDSQLIYTSFLDGAVGVFHAATLRLRCRISPSAYLPPTIRSNVYPLVIAAHPSEPNQFALGLTDGGVQVIEPLESEGEWGNGTTMENGAPSNVVAVTPATGTSGSEQTPR